MVALSLAAAVTLSGRVLDTTTGQPLAHVRVVAGNARSTTGPDGRFVLRGLAPGVATVTLQSNDVPAQRVIIRLGAGVTHQDLRACSTTLDYTCGNRAPNAPGGGAG